MAYKGDAELQELQPWCHEHRFSTFMEMTAEVRCSGSFLDAGSRAICWPGLQQNAKDFIAKKDGKPLVRRNALTLSGATVAWEHAAGSTRRHVMGSFPVCYCDVVARLCLFCHATSLGRSATVRW